MGTSNKDTEEIYVGEGILKWIQPVEPRVLKVEDLYRNNPDYWALLDILLEDRPDLHDRINKYKTTH